MFKEKFMPVLSWQRILAILALFGAIYNAYGAYSTLTWPGIAWYSLCILALIFVRDPRVIFLLWFAVAAHILFSGYQLWRWQALQVRPCIYCFAAAWCALTAAVVMYRPLLAAIPPLLLAGMVYAWADIFPPKQHAQTAPVVTVQTAVDTAEPTPAEPAVNVAVTEEPTPEDNSDDPGEAKDAAPVNGQTTETGYTPTKAAVKSTPAVSKTTTTTTAPKVAAPKAAAPEPAPVDTKTVEPSPADKTTPQPAAEPPQTEEPAASVNENPTPEPDPPAPPAEEDPDSG